MVTEDFFGSYLPFALRWCSTPTKSVKNHNIEPRLPNIERRYELRYRQPLNETELFQLLLVDAPHQQGATQQNI